MTNRISSDQRTEAKPFKSLTTDIYVDAPNYLAELICVRKAQKDGLGALPEKFWNLPKHKNLYIREVSQARNLLKTYPAKVIIAAIQSWKAKWIMSYRNKNLIPILEEEMKSFKEISVEETKQEELVSQKPLPKYNPLADL